MSQRILAAYGTKHGSTREVACAVADTLRELGLGVDIRPAGSVDNLSPYAGVVVGGALYTGRWHPEALHFLERHRRTLATMPMTKHPDTLTTKVPQGNVDGMRDWIAAATAYRASAPAAPPIAIRP